MKFVNFSRHTIPSYYSTKKIKKTSENGVSLSQIIRCCPPLRYVLEQMHCKKIYYLSSERHLIQSFQVLRKHLNLQDISSNCIKYFILKYYNFKNIQKNEFIQCGQVAFSDIMVISICLKSKKNNTKIDTTMRGCKK